MTTAPERIVIASRESALALWQARHIQAQLAQLYPAADIVILGMATEGDRRPEVSLQQVGGKGLFVKELEEALLDGRADLAVHSLKDVPMTLAPEFALAAIGERADPRDAFVSRRYRNPAEVPPGGRIGTSSLRRASQLRARYPALKVEPLRGNVPTRLTKLDRGDYEGIVVAAAGLKRLGLEDRITLIFTPEESVPAAGQGALALECRTERSDIKAWLAPLHHVATAACVAAERSFSRSLGGSCNVPLGAYSELTGTRLRLRGLVAQPDGARVVRGEADGALDAPEALGRSLAATLEAQGAGEILAALAKAGVP